MIGIILVVNMRNKTFIYQLVKDSDITRAGKSRTYKYQ